MSHDPWFGWEDAFSKPGGAKSFSIGQYRIRILPGELQGYPEGTWFYEIASLTTTISEPYLEREHAKREAMTKVYQELSRTMMEIIRYL